MEVEKAHDFDAPNNFNDGGLWESYEDDAIPAPLRDVPGWPGISQTIGQVGGVAMDTDNNLVVFHRANRRWDLRFANMNIHSRASCNILTILLLF